MISIKSLDSSSAQNGKCAALCKPLGPPLILDFAFGLVAVVYWNENAKQLKEFCTILTNLEVFVWTRILYDHLYSSSLPLLCYPDMILLHWKSVWDHCHRENNPMVVLGGQKSDYKICVLIDEISNTAGWSSKKFTTESPVLQILLYLLSWWWFEPNFHVWIHCSIVM